MPGEARTTEFLLSTATLMIGPQAKVMELNPADHSVGLIKNVTVTADLGFTELTQGTNAQLVSSVNTSNNTRIAGEVYEFTAKNLAYAAGLDAASTGFEPVVETYALGTALTVGGSSVVLATGGGADWAAGDFGVIQDNVLQDRLHVFKVLSKASDTLTLASDYALPTTGAGAAYAIATTTIYRVRAVKVGAVPVPQRFGAKLVGIMPEGGAPVTLIFPKIQVTKGMSISFHTDNFANMPFEFTPYSLVASDAFYSTFGATKPWMILKNN